MGHLLTGSNFDDSVGSVTGGRHGYGAKLANIFSTNFRIEVKDKKRGKVYKQVRCGSSSMLSMGVGVSAKGLLWPELEPKHA